MKIIRKILRIFTRKWVVIPLAVLAVIGLTLGLSLGLTLTVKSVEVEGEVILLCGETYTSGFTIKETTRAGLVHREPVTKKMLSGLDTSTSGDKKVTVRFNGRTLHPHVTVLAEEDVTVKLSGTLPTVYELNAPFATTAVFDVYYEGTIIRSAPVRTSCAPDFSSETVGNYPIELYYSDTLSVPYQYSVVRGVVPAETVNKISLVLNKTVYAVGEQFDLSSGFLRVWYAGDEGETHVELSLAMLDLVTFDEEGTYPLTVSYGGRSETAYITVIEQEYANEVTNISTLWKGTPDGVPSKGQPFDYTNAKLTVTYGGGYSTDEVAITPEMVSGCDTNIAGEKVFNTAGDQTLIITYEGKMLEIPIRVPDVDLGVVTRIIYLDGWDEVTTQNDDDIVIPAHAYLHLEIGYGNAVEDVYLKTSPFITVEGFEKTLDPQNITIVYDDGVSHLEYVIVGFCVQLVE